MIDENKSKGYYTKSEMIESVLKNKFINKFNFGD